MKRRPEDGQQFLNDSSVAKTTWLLLDEILETSNKNLPVGPFLGLAAGSGISEISLANHIMLNRISSTF